MSPRPEPRGHPRRIVDQPWSWEPRKVAAVLVAMLGVLVALVAAMGLAGRLGVEADAPVARVAVALACTLWAAHAIATFRRRKRGDGGTGPESGRRRRPR